jgi:hypothetical protein
MLKGESMIRELNFLHKLSHRPIFRKVSGPILSH